MNNNVLKKACALMMIFSMMVGMVPISSVSIVHAGILAPSGLFEGKYGMAQVFDVYRSPDYPTAGEDFEITGFNNAFNAKLTDSSDEGDYLVDWGPENDRYVQFVAAEEGLVSDTFPDADVVALNLYEADGTYKETISEFGTVWGLNSSGFFYEGHDYYGYYISNAKGIEYGSEGMVITPETGLENLETMNAYNANTVVLDAGILSGNEVPLLDVTASEGDTDFTTKLTADLEVGNHLVVKISHFEFATPVDGDKAPTGVHKIDPYISGTDITGVSAFYDKYLGVYEVENISNKVVKFKGITLTNQEIKIEKIPPILEAVSVNRTKNSIAEVRFTSDEEAEYYYEVVDAGALEPTIDMTFAGNSCENGNNLLKVEGLTGGEKDLYIVAKDINGNVGVPIKITIPVYLGLPSWEESGIYDQVFYDQLIEGTFSGSIIEIKTAGELAAMAKAVNVADVNFYGKTFSLVDDINLSGRLWEPIGMDMDAPFTGSFNGNGHTIDGMQIEGTYSAAGLFGLALNPEGFGNDPQAANFSKIQNVTVSGSIHIFGITDGVLDGKVAAGGILGVGLGVNIDDCINKTTIVMDNDSTFSLMGGIVGMLWYGNINGCINDEGANIEVAGNNTSTGGIIGMILGNVEMGVFNSENFADVTSNTTGPLIYDSEDIIPGIGGVVGACGGSSIANSSNTGNLMTAGPSIVGGIVGTMMSLNVGLLMNSIQNSYSTGTIGSNSDAMIGGLVGLVPSVYTVTPENFAGSSYLEEMADYDYNQDGDVPAIQTAKKTEAHMKSTDFLRDLNLWVASNPVFLSVGMLPWTQSATIQNGYPVLLLSEAVVDPVDPVEPVDPVDPPKNESIALVPTKIPVIIDDKIENIAFQEIKTINGIVTDVVTVDKISFDIKIIGASDESNVVVPVSDSVDATAQEVILDGQMIENMAKKEMTLELRSDAVSYFLPLQYLDVEGLSKTLGLTNLSKEVQFGITITKSDDKTQKMLNTIALKSGFTIEVNPVEFSISASYNGKTVEIDKFKNYVAREVKLPIGVDATRITTAVVTDADGTVRHVPTFVYEKEGRQYARINSLTNSVYTLIYNKAVFKDTVGTWFEDMAAEMASRKVITGYADQIFWGNKAITRAEFTTILINSLGISPDAESDFSDVDKDSWYYGAVSSAYQMGLVKGVDEKRFNPNVSISRQEAMVMIMKASELCKMSAVGTANMSVFSDQDKVATWAKKAVEYNISNQLIVGSGGKINPTKSITRAETAAIIMHMLQNAGLINK